MFTLAIMAVSQNCLQSTNFLHFDLNRQKCPKMSGRGARCVFGTESSVVFPNCSLILVGNIPYDATEQQLTDIFSQVGPVVSFRCASWGVSFSICCRLVFDRDSGKPKGFGFCEYRDAETAQSAIRNLNGVEANGRPLRVDFAENEVQTLLLRCTTLAHFTQKLTGPGGVLVPGPGSADRERGGRREPPPPPAPVPAAPAPTATVTL